MDIALNQTVTTSCHTTVNFEAQAREVHVPNFFYKLMLSGTSKFISR